VTKALGIDAFFLLPFTALVISAAVIDIRTRKIPDGIAFTGLALAVATNLARSFVYSDYSYIVNCAAGMVAGGLPLYLAALLSRNGMGMGDVKFMAMIGSFLGPRCGLEALFTAVLAGGLYGAALIVIKKRSVKSAFAFGPFLAFGGLTVVFFDGFIHLVLAAVYHIPV